MSIAELFGKLKDSPSGHAYTAAKIEGRGNLYLGVNLAGQPCLLVLAEGRSPDPPLRAAKVLFRPAQEFSVAVDGDLLSRQLFHMLSCESSDKGEVESFLIVIDAFLASHADQPIQSSTLTDFFRSMVRLFAVVPARDLAAQRQGLWGELFLMRQVRGFRFWAPYWHSEVTRIFDFSSREKRVEVKTSAAAQRVHHFSHRQIYALEGEEIVLASLMLREEDAGLSLRDLIGGCRAVLNGTPDYLKLESAVRRAGMEDSTIEGPRFDAMQAHRELAWFRSVDAPHFRMPEPPGVSETRYKVDLSTAPRVASEELERWLGEWTTDAREIAAGLREPRS